jgi:hypothetical protein
LNGVVRLSLSSFRLGDHADRLRQLAGDERRAAVVMNAVDAADGQQRADRLRDELVALDEVGLEPN